MRCSSEWSTIRESEARWRTCPETNGTRAWLWARDCDRHLRCARRRTKRREGRCHDCRRGGCRARELDWGAADACWIELEHHARRSTRRGAQTPEAAAPDVVAFVRLELGRDGALRLRILDPRRRRVLARSLPVPNGIDEIVREEASHIVIYAVEAIARGEDVGEPQPPAAAPRIRTRSNGGHRAKRRAVAGARDLRRRPATPASAPPSSARARGSPSRRVEAESGSAERSRSSKGRRSSSRRCRRPRASPSARCMQRSGGEFPIAPSVVFQTSAGAAVDVGNATTVALRPTSEPRRPAFVDAVAVVDLTAGVRIARSTTRRGRGGRGRASALLLAIRRRGRARTRPRPPLTALAAPRRSSHGGRSILSANIRSTRGRTKNRTSRPPPRSLGAADGHINR